MTTRRRRASTARIYTKMLASDGRRVFYGDFRVFRAVGGKQEALCAAGELRATADPAVAQTLFAARLAMYTARAAQSPAAPSVVTCTRAFPETLHDAFAVHLRRRAESGKRAVGTLVGNERHARTLIRLLGDIPLRSITSEVLTRFVVLRRAERNPKTAAPLSPRTINNELTTLSSLLKRARNAGVVTTNPFDGWDDRPAQLSLERNFLTRDQGRALLAAAEQLDAEAHERLAASANPVCPPPPRASGGRVPPAPPRLHDCTAAIVATLLYTGGRRGEVLGLDVADLDFTHDLIWFRKNRFRGLKRPWCHRAVPMPPALRQRLAAHVQRFSLRPGLPVFCGIDRAIPMSNPAKLLRRCGVRAKLAGPSLTAHALRHTFATAMIQTFVTLPDGRLAVRSNWDVAKLLGHRSTLLVDTVYAHWLTDQHYHDSLDFEPIVPTTASARAA